jgi:2-keto-3-deoxy-L-rhamnonate aldolase RhmA
MIPSPQIVEMIGRLGFDWVLIDFEHGAISPETLQAHGAAPPAPHVSPLTKLSLHKIVHPLTCASSAITANLPSAGLFAV